MRFALLGDHPDGLAMTRALIESGRHQLSAYSGPPLGWQYLSRWDVRAAQVSDLEEILADPGVEAVIVASGPALRAGQLRRALQSERHVLCVHPADRKPDLAYEAALLQQDSGKALVPLLPEALHPAIERLADLMHGTSRQPATAAALQQFTAAPPSASVSPRRLHAVRTPNAPPACLLGTPRLLAIERRLSGSLFDPDDEGGAGITGWEMLRCLGGEVAEIMALSPGEELSAEQPLLLAGRFVGGLLFQSASLPDEADAALVIHLHGSEGDLSLEFGSGWHGEARLSYRDLEGRSQTEEWAAFEPWAAMVEVWEMAVSRADRGREQTAEPEAGGRVTWQDAVRALELDDAVRRSVARRRASTLDHQEISEESTFKGTMTLVGCSLLWTSLMLLILSAWAPWLGWFILPVFGAFLAMQLLGWAVPQKPASPKAPARPGSRDE